MVIVHGKVHGDQKDRYGIHGGVLAEKMLQPYLRYALSRTSLVTYINVERRSRCVNRCLSIQRTDTAK